MPDPRVATRRAPERIADRLGWADVLASISDGVVILDADGVVGDLNPAAELLTGVSASHAIGRPIGDVFAGPRHAWLVTLATATLAEAVARRRTEETLQSPGREVVVSTTCAPVQDPNGTLRGAVIVLHDLTLQRILEAATRRSEGLAALDTVAAGLAHEIRNPLGGIRGAAQLLRAALTDPDQIRCTELIVREVDRLDGLVDQLHALGSPHTLNRVPTNVHRLLNDVLALRRQDPAWGDVQLVTEFDPSLPPVLGDRAQLTQVFLNLVKNAVEALDGSGTLTIVTRLDTSYRVRRGSGQAHFLVITVSDDGPGVAEPDRARLFAPFFSTKAGGTGLGLALSQRIVAQHGGTIEYDPPPRRGARFRVTLPLAEDSDAGES